MTHPDDAYWANLSGMGDAADNAASVVSLKTIEAIEPLDAQLGLVEPVTVPRALREPLFGQTAAITGRAIVPLHTYAVLDAAKVSGLPEMLETSGLDHACLFQGAAAEELRDVAPYLVRLEERHSFTRALFTRGDGPAQLWDREPGIFLRSQGSLDELRKHLRKFTKVRDENGKWFYVRFYDPTSACETLDQDKYWAALLDVSLVQTGVFQTSHTIWIAISTKSRGSCRRTLDLELERQKELERKIGLNAATVVTCLRIPSNRRHEAEQAAQSCIRRMMGYGFRNTRHLRVMASWELVFGHCYEEYDPSGILLTICHSHEPALRRFKKFSKRMDNVGFTARSW